MNPKELKEVNGEFLLSWANKSKENLEWLRAKSLENCIEVKGVKRPNIMKIRSLWAQEFMPSLIPEKKEKAKQKTMWELIFSED